MKCQVCGGALSFRSPKAEGRGCASCGHFEYFKEPVVPDPDLTDEEITEALEAVEEGDTDEVVGTTDLPTGDLTEEALEPVVSASKDGSRKGKKGKKK